MVTQKILREENKLARWIYLDGGNVQTTLYFIQTRLDANNNIYPTYYLDFNQRYQTNFSSNENLLGTLRRMYNELSKSKATYNKNFAQQIKNVYDNPTQIPQLSSFWFNMLLTPFLNYFDSEKILNVKSNFASIGYYINEQEIECESLFEFDSNSKKFLYEILYEKWCNCVEQLAKYYKATSYYDKNFVQNSQNPLEISILLCFQTNSIAEYFFNINFHAFKDLKALKNEIEKLKKWSGKNKHTNNTPDEITDKKPETPDLEELVLIWSRPVINLSSNNGFMERKNEIGKRISNYIKYI